MWIIKDWAGNICFKDKEFLTFENAWEFIYAFTDNEEDYEDYYVVSKGKKYA